MHAETFGAGLQYWRGRRGLSLRGLAELAHYSKSQLSDLERGARHVREDVADHLDNVLGAEGALRALIDPGSSPSSEPPTLDARSYTGSSQMRV